MQLHREVFFGIQSAEEHQKREVIAVDLRLRQRFAGKRLLENAVNLAVVRRGKDHRRHRLVGCNAAHGKKEVEPFFERFFQIIKRFHRHIRRI